jgi:hypothetical protein
MPLQPAPDHMYSYRNKTITCFGYDTNGNASYKFNSLGYRGEEFNSSHPAIICLGNTCTFGLGLSYSETFAGIIENNVSCSVYNFAWGCYKHTNKDQLYLLKNILGEIKPRHVIFQINNLDRIKVNGLIFSNNTNESVLQEYTEFKIALDAILKNLPHSLLYWDNKNYPIDFSDCLIYNKYHVDNSIFTNTNTFGKKTHQLIAKKLLQQNL